MLYKKVIICLFFCTLGGLGCICQNQEKKSAINNDWITKLADTCIYNHNNHAAFTTLEEWKGDLYLAFREAGFHRPTETDKGKIKVLYQKGKQWKTNHIFSLEGKDLRDPYILRWNDRLLLYTVEYYSEIGQKGWKDLKPIKHDAPYHLNIWKKRIHNDILYGVGNRGGQWPLLLKSTDGENWNVVSEYRLGGNASEADTAFVRDTMFVCIRIDTPVGSNSLWGKSVYPFTECEWTIMDISIASPEIIVHSDNTLLLAGREYVYSNITQNKTRYVSIFALSRDGKVKGRYVVDRLGGDQGYASFYKHKKNEYYMSYYTGKKNTAVRLFSFKIDENKLK